jgi:hypothetical protein
MVSVDCGLFFYKGSIRNQQQPLVQRVLLCSVGSIWLMDARVANAALATANNTQVRALHVFFYLVEEVEC